ncbi:zinc finger, CCHC-type containing protein [Tanacetum coccineum]
MNQHWASNLPGNETMCKLIKSLYGLKHAPKQWHQKFDEVVLSNGYLLNQADKFQVDLTKEFLSSRFSMKDIGEAYVILGIRIKHESNGIAISQSHYIEKVLKKFNYSNCTLVSTPLDTCEKLMPNKGMAVSQLEYSRVIGCLMYAMTCTRPDIAFAVGKLSRDLFIPVSGVEVRSVHPEVPEHPDSDSGYHQRVIHQRKYPQWVSSSEVVSVLNHQRVEMFTLESDSTIPSDYSVANLGSALGETLESAIPIEAEKSDVGADQEPT